jgi:hypothetical protein
VQDNKASYLYNNLLDLSMQNNNINRSSLHTKPRQKDAFSTKQLVYGGEIFNEDFLFENTINLNSIDNNRQGLNINYNPVRDSSVKFAFSNTNQSNFNNHNNDNTRNKLNNSLSNRRSSSSGMNNFNIQKNNYWFYFDLQKKKLENSVSSANYKIKNDGFNNCISRNNLSFHTKDYNSNVEYIKYNSNLENFQNPNNSNHENNCDAVDISSSNNHQFNQKNFNVINANKFIKGAAYEKVSNVDNALLANKKHESASSFFLNQKRNGNNNNNNIQIQNDRTEKIKGFFSNTRNSINNNHYNFSFTYAKSEGTSAEKNCNPNKLLSMKNSCISNHQKNDHNLNKNYPNNNYKYFKNPDEIINQKTYKLIEANKKSSVNKKSSLKNKRIHTRKKANETFTNKNHNSRTESLPNGQMFFISTDKRHSYNNYQEPSYFTKKSKSKSKSKEIHKKNLTQKNQNENFSEIKNVNLFDLKITKGIFAVRDEEIKNNRILDDISTVSYNNNLRVFSENGNKFDFILKPESICSGLELQEEKISPIASPRSKAEILNMNDNSGNIKINLGSNNEIISNALIEDVCLKHIGNILDHDFENHDVNSKCENVSNKAQYIKFILIFFANLKEL